MIGERQLVAVVRPLMGQFARPHGPLGWLAALAIPMAHRPYYAKTARALHLRPDDVLLDVACGSGEFLAEQAGEVGDVTGVDVSDIEVRRARRRLRDRIAAGTARVVQGDAADLPLPDASFTAVNCVGSFLAFDDPGRALAEMHRVLVPGGRAVVLLEMHAQAGREQSVEKGLLGDRLYSEQQVRDLFTGAGFERVEFSYDGEIMVVRGMTASR